MLTLSVNGKNRDVQSSQDTPLLYVLRDELGVDSPQFGCGLAQCGAVAFVLGTGEDTQQVTSGDISRLLKDRETRSHGHAILHALDAHTGKELWSSEDTILAGPISPGSPSVTVKFLQPRVMEESTPLGCVGQDPLNPA
jgi:hypothetical protein